MKTKTRNDYQTIAHQGYLIKQFARLTWIEQNGIFICYVESLTEGMATVEHLLEMREAGLRIKGLKATTK
jgi:hypothetical protein